VIFRIIAIILFFNSEILATSAPNLFLVKDGVPKAVVVVSDSPTVKEKEAARLVVEYIEKITGATLPIVKESKQIGNHPRIIIGRNNLQSKSGITVRQGGYPVREQVIIKRVGNDLYLLGNDSYSYDGTYIAACMLLEHFGVRWYWPGEVGEVVPRRKTLKMPDLDIMEIPDFPFRLGQWYDRAIEKQSGSLAQWKRHNRYGGATIYASHNLSNIIPPEKYFKKHPEWFAMINGKRVPDRQPCTSHPEVRRLAIKAANDYFDSHPEAAMFSLCQNDFAGYCECPLCKAIDKRPSGRLVDFANAVSDGLKPQYKGKLLAIMAYDSKATEPPASDIKARPNVVVSLIHFDGRCQFHPITYPAPHHKRYRELLDQWSKVADNIIWSEHDNDDWTGSLVVPQLFSNIPYLHTKNVIGYLEQCLPVWPWLGLSYYLDGRLLWDSNLDSQSIIDEYFRKFFGPAEDPIKTFYFKLDEFVRAEPCRLCRYIPSAETIHAIEPFLKEAEKAVASGPAKPKQRIEMIRKAFDLWKHIHAAKSASDAFLKTPNMDTWKKAADAAYRVYEYAKSISGQNIISYNRFCKGPYQYISPDLLRERTLHPDMAKEAAQRLERMKTNLLPSLEIDSDRNGVPDRWVKGYTFYKAYDKIRYRLFRTSEKITEPFLRILIGAPTKHIFKSEPILVVPNRQYRFSQKIRGENIRVIRYFVKEYDSQGKNIGTPRRLRTVNKISREWQSDNQFFKTSDKTQTVELEIQISCIGVKSISQSKPAYVDLSGLTLDEGFQGL